MPHSILWMDSQMCSNIISYVLEIFFVLMYISANTIIVLVFRTIHLLPKMTTCVLLRLLSPLVKRRLMRCMPGSLNQWTNLSLDGTCQSYGSFLGPTHQRRSSPKIEHSRILHTLMWLLPLIQQSLAKSLLPPLWKH
jgi:hypothetical protein